MDVKKELVQAKRSMRRGDPGDYRGIRHSGMTTMEGFSVLATSHSAISKVTTGIMLHCIYDCKQ